MLSVVNTVTAWQRKWFVFAVRTIFFLLTIAFIHDERMRAKQAV